MGKFAVSQDKSFWTEVASETALKTIIHPGGWQSVGKVAGHVLRNFVSPSNLK